MDNTANFEFLFGLAFSIPVAVLAPYATKWVERYRSKRSAHQAEIRRGQIQADITLISNYRDNPSYFNSYLVGRILLLTVISAFGTLGSTFFYTFGNVIGSFELAQITGGAVVILSAVFVIQIGMQSLVVRRRVLRSDAFLTRANAELAGLKTRENGHIKDARQNGARALAEVNSPAGKKKSIEKKKRPRPAKAAHG